MGKRGPKPKPTDLKVFEGNPGKRPLNDQEPQPERAIPDCPEHLDEVARAEWERITPELDAIGMLSRNDRAALAAYCQAWSRWVQAEEAIIQTGGTVVKAPSGYPMQNPHLSIANKALEHLKSFAGHFGLTPSSRSTLKVEKPKPKDELGDFLAG